MRAAQNRAGDAIFIFIPIIPPVMGPGKLLDLPSIVVNSCGKDRVVYLPWLVGGVYELDEPYGILKLYRGVVNWLLDGRKIIELNGPRSCEVSLREKDGKYIFHIIDYTGSYKVLDEPGLEAVSGKLMLPDGRIVCMLRVHMKNDNQGGYYLYQSESEDSGRSWSTSWKTDIWGHPAHLILLKSGKVLCAYGYRRPPYGVRACLSSDEGRT